MKMIPLPSNEVLDELLDYDPDTGVFNMTDAPDSMPVHCGLCRHEWFALKLPMLMMDAAVLMENMVCPECDEWSHNIYCGLAPVDKLNTSAERVNEIGES
jgi:hypothetical protein